MSAPELWPDELRNIAGIAETLDTIPEAFKYISLGHVDLYDVNGEKVGTLEWNGDRHVFNPGGERA